MWYMARWSSRKRDAARGRSRKMGPTTGQRKSPAANPRNERVLHAENVSDPHTESVHDDRKRDLRRNQVTILLREFSYTLSAVRSKSGGNTVLMKRSTPSR